MLEMFSKTSIAHLIECIEKATSLSIRHSSLSDVSATAPEVTSRVQTLANAYNNRDIGMLTSFYSSHVVSSQHYKPRWVGHSPALTYATTDVDPDFHSFNYGIPNIPILPPFVKLMIKQPDVQLKTRDVSGTRDFSAWEWEYDFLHISPEPSLPGIPTGQMLTMRGTSLIHQTREGPNWKVIRQMEYSSLLNWTERFTRRWPGDEPTGVQPTANRALGPRPHFPGPSQTTPSANSQRPPSRLYPFPSFCTCHPDPLDLNSPRTLWGNSEETASSATSPEASPSPPPMVRFPGRPEVYRTYTVHVPSPE